jgi:hypothetical protein
VEEKVEKEKCSKQPLKKKVVKLFLKTTTYTYNEISYSEKSVILNRLFPSSPLSIDQVWFN